MGYKWRKTLGHLDCRPNRFKTNFFPKPSSTCDYKCLYSIFCKEIGYMSEPSLGDRIKKIRLLLQKPYFLLSLLGDGDIMLILEDGDKKRLSFRGHSIIEAIETTEEYIDRETKMGTLKPIKEEEDEVEE